MITRFYLICTFLCAIFTTDAQDNADIHVADSLFKSQRYFESGIAYERVLFTGGSPSEEYDAVNGKVQSLKQQQKYATAVQFIKTHLNGRMPDTLRYHLYTEQALCSYLAKNYEEALAATDLISVMYPGRTKDNKVMLIRLLALNELQRWDEAAKTFAVFAEGKPAGSVQNPYNKLPRLKSKDKAQWLSTFIPGAGQIYAGKPLEAVASIVLQGAGIYFGITSFLQHYYLAAWLAGAGLTGSVHMGGVRRSEILVDQYNRKQISKFNRKVKELLLQLAE